MKTIFTLFLSMILGVSVFAAAPASMITVRSMSTADIRVELDGRRYEPNNNAVILSNIESGSHLIKVYLEKNTSLFNLFGKRYEMVYNTTITVNKRSNFQITVEKNGRITMQQTKIKGSKNSGYDTRNGYDPQQGQWGGYDSHEGYASGMNDREFQVTLQSINKEWLEGNKMKSAGQVVRTNNLTSAQVKQLVQLFGFENNKLELAKQAYVNTVDKRNYYLVSNLLTFQASRDDLARYIADCR